MYLNDLITSISKVISWEIIIKALQYYKMHNAKFGEEAQW